MTDAPIFRACLLRKAVLAVTDAQARQRLDLLIAAMTEDIEAMELWDRNETVGLIARIRQLLRLADRGGSREAESVMGEFVRMRGVR